MGIEIVGLLAALLILGFLCLQPGRSRVAIINRLPDFSVASTEDGRVVMLGFPCREGDPQAQALMRQTLLPAHMFALGAMSGVGAALTAAKLALGSGAPANSVIWLCVWLGIVGATWCLSYMVERCGVARMRARGRFDEILLAGADPLRVAAALHYCGRRFAIWSVVVAFLGGSLLTATDAQGAIISLFMLAAAGVFYLHMRSTSFSWATPRDLERRLLTAREHLLDGGWVVPAGVLLMAASVGLLYFYRTRTSLIMSLAVTGIALVLWSERVSRLESHRYGLDELRSRLKQRLTQDSAVSAVIHNLV